MNRKLIFKTSLRETCLTLVTSHNIIVSVEKNHFSLVTVLSHAFQLFKFPLFQPLYDPLSTMGTRNYSDFSDVPGYQTQQNGHHRMVW